MSPAMARSPRLMLRPQKPRLTEAAVADQQPVSSGLTDPFVPLVVPAAGRGGVRTGATPRSPSRRPLADRIADALSPKAFADRTVLLSILSGIAFSTYYFPYSNQHSYFLHPLARWGNKPLLGTDWLYNTTEPYIFFNYAHMIASVVPELTSMIIFLLFVIVLSLGFLSIYRLLVDAFDVPVWFSVAFVMILCNPAATLLFEKYTVGPAFFLGGIANQSLFYPPPLYYQPSSVALLYFVALWLVSQSRFTAAFALSAFIALMHPIMLVSSFFFFCALILVLWREVVFSRVIFWAILSLSIVLPGLIYQIISNYGFELSEIAAAHHIMLDVRTPHETDVRVWFGWDDAIRVLLIAFGAGAAIAHKLYKRRVVRVFLGITVFSVVGSLITFATGNETMRLVQPWRTSIVYLPLLTAFSVWVVLGPIACKLFRFATIRLVTTCAIAASVLSPVVISYKLYQFERSDERRAFYERLKPLHDDEAVLAHMPRSFDDLRLNAGLPIFVDFKNPAFTAGELIEWDRRVRFVESIDFSQCRETAGRMRQEGIGFFLFDKQLDEKQISAIRHCPIEPVLQSDRFLVYRVDGRER
jgi:hypothetical protein